MIQTKKDILRLEDEIKEMKSKCSYLTKANFNELIEENWFR